VDNHYSMKGKTHKTRPHADIIWQKSTTLEHRVKKITEGKRHCKGKVNCCLKTKNQQVGKTEMTMQKGKRDLI
jgi:hypothetical protein